jgi:hypothetical protein
MFDPAQLPHRSLIAAFEINGISIGQDQAVDRRLVGGPRISDTSVLLETDRLGTSGRATRAPVWFGI